jgi:peptidyl-Lys metalloendopeptidase
VKRAAPRPEEYVAIGPGQSVSVVVDLSRAYAIYDPGDYTVEFTSKVFDFGQRMPAELAAKKVFVPKLIRSNTVTIRVAEKRAELMPKPAAVGVEAKAPVFESCSQSQQTTLNTAHTNAQNYAMGSYLALVGTSVAKRANAKRYTTWFGTYDGTRYNTVASHFLKIFDAFSKQTVTFNCDCDENYYAYVYPSNPYKIYLCKVFWNAPATGTDSQFGTLIHEMSHFYVVASTDDHAYGQSSCKTLATNDPAKAIDNADSHEYFAENDPPLSMGLHLAAYSLMFIFGVALVYSFVYWLTRRGRAAAGWTE